MNLAHSLQSYFLCLSDVVIQNQNFEMLLN
jgi:hypothetical protein